MAALDFQQLGLLLSELMPIPYLLFDRADLIGLLRNARRAYQAVTIAKTARTAVASAVSWVAKMTDMEEGYGAERL